MSDNKDNKTIVTEVEMDIDALLGGDNVMVPSGNEPVKNNIFSRKGEDLSFLDKPPVKGDNDDPDKDKDKDKDQELDENGKPKVVTPVTSTELDNIITAATDDADDKKSGRPRVDKAGLVELANSLIEKKLLVPFDDGKDIADYTLKDFEELFEANDAERERKVREQVPGEFIKALPPELQYAAEYALKGGTDMQGLFKSLAAVEEVKSLDPSNEHDQKHIVRSYLQATNFGDAEEIEEEINSWADRNELEAKANKFKPKLDALSEQQVQYKLHQQEQLRAQQAEQSKVYTDNIFKTLEPGELNGLKLDRKTQNLLFSGLVQPNFPSVSGKQTNLLGHLLEKYQYVEPNHALLAEALWLLADPDGYKNKVRDVSKKEVVTDTVRKLKTEEGKRIASHAEEDEKDNKKAVKGIPRPGAGFFKR
jgi:hypothetical protein